MAQRALLLVICFLLYKTAHCREQSCVQEDPCLCRFNELQKIDLWPLAKSSSGFYFAASANAKYFFRVCEDYTGKPITCGFNSKLNKNVSCEAPFAVSSCFVTSVSCVFSILLQFCKCDTANNVTTTLSIKDRSFVDTVSDAYTEKFVYTQGNK